MGSAVRHLRICFALLALTTALVAGAFPVQASETDRVFAVDVPDLGPMLFSGSDARTAVRSYVKSLVRRQVFPKSGAELSAWERTMEDSAGPSKTVETLRVAGQPVIGIQLNRERDLLGDARAKDWRRRIADGVRRAGGIPVFLPPGASTAQTGPLVAAIDHLVLAGGPDVDPSFYGQPKRYAQGTNPQVDRHDIQMIHGAMSRGIGIDGICRGHQILNVALNGTLIQDLAADDVTAQPHRSTETGPLLRHTVALEAGSEIARSTGSLSTRWVSAHHEAVGTPGKGLTAVGWSPDGVIEAVEGYEGRVRGYQFHPEMSRGEAAQGIFKSITERAAKFVRR